MKAAIRKHQSNKENESKTSKDETEKFWSYVRQKTVLVNAIPALIKEDGSLTTNEGEKS